MQLPAWQGAKLAACCLQATLTLPASNVLSGAGPYLQGPAFNCCMWPAGVWLQLLCLGR